MKRLSGIVSLLSFAFAVQANPQFALTIGENGVGSFQVPTPADLPITGLLAADPVSGIITLCYDLTPYGFTFASGDVDILTLGQTKTNDVVRFEQDFPGHAGSFIYFFSEVEAGQASLADVGLPLQPLSSVVFATEGVELDNAAVYRPPLSGSAGYHSDTTYTFITEVPEPTTLAVWGLVGGLLMVCKGRRT
jgi:hypothetical protein